MRLTHGEIRGVTALGVLLCCILGVMAVLRGCEGGDGTAADHELVERMKARVDSLGRAAGAEPDAEADSASVFLPGGRSGAAGRRGSRGVKKEKTRRVVADRPSPLDDVNSR